MTEPSAHFLDDAEYDWSKPEAVELFEIMVRAYGTDRGMIDRSGIDRHRINFKQSPRDIWKEALEVAAAEGHTRKLAQNARNDRSITAYHRRLDRLLGPHPAPIEAAPPANARIVWSGQEVITGKQPTFLEMSFFHEGLRIAPSVVRLSTTSQDDHFAFGSGFLIAPNTILTNHHVLYASGRPMKEVDIWFNFELDASGRPLVVDRYEGDVSTIQGEEADDWAILKPKKPFKDTYKPLNVHPSKPVTRGDFVYIVQHPGGQLKKIGLVHNEVVHVDQARVQYLTDTLPGSSGSPVCNELWQVVALHAQGIKGDPTKEQPYKNEGIRIDRVVEALSARGILEPRAQP
ncbi:trypsin-like peptidase domain-containing protein [Polyangium sp. y55x31]|uniref:trypsin-like peptidase domain-containing protein n=1 Tax=Polyangium sp. y55x31 TaxID=3042688 RepID=UPI002482FBF9|nr:trypsin-like peptidase domain-containing protein [Polyangium sp. y55x31]MDI1480551.1 trypsin-like peptidase domain-containing protein [Polyangium sp. y55x31]